MQYAAFIHREGKYVLAEFPDCPGCQTFTDDGDELPGRAREALEGWLEAHLTSGQVPPRPVDRTGAPRGKRLAQVGVRPGLAAALEIRWARTDADLSQAELGKLARVSQQQIAKLENPDENPTLETFAKVAKALKLDVTIGLEPQPRMSLPPPAPRVRRSSRSTPASR